MPAVIGPRQQEILDLLVERGGSLCLEVIIRALAEVPADRDRIIRAIGRLAATGVVLLAGNRARAQPGTVVRLSDRATGLQHAASVSNATTDQWPIVSEADPVVLCRVRDRAPVQAFPE